MQKLKSLVFIVFSLVLFSCGGGTVYVADLPSTSDSLKFGYASLLSYYVYPHYEVAVVRDAWGHGSSERRYILIPKDAELPDSLPEGVVLRTPLSSMACFSSVHCSMFSLLGSFSSIVGVCDVSYILNSSVLSAVKKGKVADLGSSLSPNIERIISLNSDALFVSPYENSNFGMLEKTHLPRVECSDYMEISALGRAEWIRFYGRLVGKADEADSIFDMVEKNYNKLKASVKGKKKPRLMVDKMDGAVWYVPGGRSTMGRIFMDAGADYVFGDNEKSGSVALSFEQVYDKARTADIWVIKYGQKNDYTYKTLGEQDSYREFGAFKNRRIFGCNTDHIPFYEEAPFRPDLLLRNLINAFHPDATGGKSYKYYTPLNE